MNSLNVVTSFPLEKAIYFREHTSGMYSSWTWYIANRAASIFLSTLAPLITAILTYWIIGFRVSFTAFLIYLLVLWLLAGAGSGLGTLLGVGAASASVALQLVPLTILPFFVFSGFLLNTADVPPWFIWIEAISPFRYGFEALVYNEFDNSRQFVCNADEMVLNPATGDMECRISNGSQVIDNLNFNLGILNSVLILIGLYCCTFLTAYPLLLYKTRSKINA